MANVHRIKQDICEIGRRIYNKGFAAANDGNITVRTGENEVLCTPTMHSKGFLKPEDICTIDMTGKQLAGIKKRSSEALLHLEIYKARADVKSVVHCHPPHATAFAIAHEPIPQCVLPEVEVFLGDVPITKYETPGGKQFAETVLPYVAKTNVIILANHGTVSYGTDVERAYWWTEILDSYCRILLLSSPKNSCWTVSRKGWSKTNTDRSRIPSGPSLLRPIFAASRSSMRLVVGSRRHHPSRSKRHVIKRHAGSSLWNADGCFCCRRAKTTGGSFPLEIPCKLF